MVVGHPKFLLHKSSPGGDLNFRAILSPRRIPCASFELFAKAMVAIETRQRLFQ